MAYLKHEGNDNGRKKKAKATKVQESNGPVNVVVSGPPDDFLRSTSVKHEVNYVHGLDGIEQSLDWIARGLEKLANDDRSVSLCTYDGIFPVKITLGENINDDTMDRFITALERIADSVAKLVGFSRPRLEPWHEQAEYDPPRRSEMLDGGAPGPKTDATQSDNS